MKSTNTKAYLIGVFGPYSVNLIIGKKDDFIINDVPSKHNKINKSDAKHLSYYAVGYMETFGPEGSNYHIDGYQYMTSLDNEDQIIGEYRNIVKSDTFKCVCLSLRYDNNAIDQYNLNKVVDTLQPGTTYTVEQGSILGTIYGKIEMNNEMLSAPTIVNAYEQSKTFTVIEETKIAKVTAVPI